MFCARRPRKPNTASNAQMSLKPLTCATIAIHQVGIRVRPRGATAVMPASKPTRQPRRSWWERQPDGVKIAIITGVTTGLAAVAVALVGPRPSVLFRPAIVLVSPAAQSSSPSDVVFRQFVAFARHHFDACGRKYSNYPCPAATSPHSATSFLRSGSWTLIRGRPRLWLRRLVSEFSDLRPVHAPSAATSGGGSPSSTASG
jgi:hypothetical protein